MELVLHLSFVRGADIQVKGSYFDSMTLFYLESLFYVHKFVQ
jgi:hypothetical protein